MKLICHLFMLTFCTFNLFGGVDEDYPVKYEGAEKFRYYDADTSRLKIIADFLPQNPMIFEAGGHYGDNTIGFIEQWPNAEVVSFEPNPNAYSKLEKVTKQIPGIKIYNLAVNDYNGTAMLHVCYGSNGDDDAFEGASSLLEASESMKQHYQGPKVEVPCVILDDWCKANKVNNFDFMWLDLEGLELQILRCSPNILDTVKVIYVETNFYKFRKGTTQYKNLRKFLEQNNFELVAHWYRQGLQGNAIFKRITH